MKPARIRELKVFVILFIGFFFIGFLGLFLATHFIAPLVIWISHGALTFPSIVIKDILRIAGYATGGGVIAATIIFLEGKYNGRW